MRAKVNKMTATVQQAQAMYPGRLAAAVDYIGQPAYGKQQIDRRTADNQLVRMLPDQLQALAQTDPQAYTNAQDRLATLRERAADQESLPGQGTYEGQP